MGFFSWRCAKSDKPIMAETAVVNTPWAFASKVVVLYKNGSCIKGTYDGYGRIIHNGEEIELTDIPEEHWRLIIEKYYENEKFEDFLLKNKWDQGQGFFYSDEDLEAEFGVTV
jgi:hypothetical protein